MEEKKHAWRKSKIINFKSGSEIPMELVNGTYQIELEVDNVLSQSPAEKPFPEGQASK